MTEKALSAVHQVFGGNAVLDRTVGFEKGCKVIGKAHEAAVDGLKIVAVKAAVQIFPRNRFALSVPPYTVYEFVVRIITQFVGKKSEFNETDKGLPKNFSLRSISLV